VPRAYPTPSVASECDPSPARAPSSAAAVDKLSIDGDLSTTETDDARTMHLVCIVAASSRSTPPRLALHAMHAEMRPPIDPSFCSVCFFSICARISPLPVPNDSLPKITVNDTICFFYQSAISSLVISNRNSFRGNTHRHNSVYSDDGYCHRHFFKVEFARESYFSCYRKRSVA